MCVILHILSQVIKSGRRRRNRVRPDQIPILTMVSSTWTEWHPSTTHAFKQWGNMCFSHAEPGRVRMGDLSSALGVTARNITTIVDALEREGLLMRKPDPTDRRAILLELTERACMGRTPNDQPLV